MTRPARTTLPGRRRRLSAALAALASATMCATAVPALQAQPVAPVSAAPGTRTAAHPPSADGLALC